jgi:hypothetical protein
MIPLLAVPTAYCFSASTQISSLHVTGCLTPMLEIDWPTMTIARRPGNIDIVHLPVFYNLTYVLAWRIRRVIRRPYLSTLVISHSGRIHEVVIDQAPLSVVSSVPGIMSVSQPGSSGDPPMGLP